MIDTRDEAAVEQVRRTVTWQVEHLSSVVDELAVILALLGQGQPVSEHLSHVMDDLAEALGTLGGEPNSSRSQARPGNAGRNCSPRV
jgi:hypothetical protein